MGHLCAVRLPDPVGTYLCNKFHRKLQWTVHVPVYSGLDKIFSLGVDNFVAVNVSAYLIVSSLACHFYYYYYIFSLSPLVCLKFQSWKLHKMLKVSKKKKKSWKTNMKESIKIWFFYKLVIGSLIIIRLLMMRVTSPSFIMLAL